MARYKINNLAEATAYFIREFTLGLGKLVGSVDGKKGPVSKIVASNEKLYYVTRKTEWFRNFSKINSLVRGLGEGQGFNLDIIQRAVLADAHLPSFIVLVMATDGDTYYRRSQEIYDWINQHNSITQIGLDYDVDVGCVPRDWLTPMVPPPVMQFGEH